MADKGSEELSIVEYFYDARGPKGHLCGYCSKDGGSKSNGMWAHKLSCRDYQDLIDRGWRRSGLYCYKPLMDKTCCPPYTIRCKALQFQLSRSQKKVLVKLRKYLDTGSIKDPIGEGSSSQTEQCTKQGLSEESGVDTSAVKQTTFDKRPGHKATPPSKGGASWSHLQSKEQVKKTLDDFITIGDVMVGRAHRLEVKLIRSFPKSPEFNVTFNDVYSLYKKYQMTIHKDEEGECNKEQFTRFLVDCSLVPSESGNGAPPFGAYHQHYYLDGKLIMVGVIDILPDCLSSVYVFYDPDIMFLSPGVVSALYELAYTKHLHQMIPSLQYYYMGYYIHTCQKMRYKGQYSPSSLLCPETYIFTPIEKCTPKLDQSLYSRFEEDVSKQTDSVDEYLPSVLVLCDHQVIPYRMFCEIFKDRSSEKIREYAALVGKTVASRMLLYQDLD